MSSAPAQAPETKKWAAWLIIILALVAVTGLAVMNSTAAQRGATSAAPADATTIDVSVDGMAFVPASVDIPAGTHLVVNFTNTGDQVHDLKIGGAETSRVEPGESAVLDVGVVTESVEGYCTIAGHKMQGMTFMVNVTDDPAAGEQSTSGHHHAVAAPANVPSLAERMAPREDFEAFDPVLKPAKGTVHEETWTMTEEEVEVAPGVRQTRWLFNGQAPGPTLRGTVGDTFRITIKNEGSMGHSVDFHAGEVSPNETMKTIQPGESLTYEFVAHRAGAWMYHCSTMPMSLHIANGMAGAVIIDPKGEDALSDVDAEYLLTSAEVFLAAEGSEAEGADPQRVSDGSYDLTSFNYYPNQYDDGLAPLHAKVGDTVRIWLVNLGPDLPLSFHVVGEIFDTVYKEGAYLLQDAEDSGSQAVDLLPAQGGFVEMTFNEPGTYSFVNHLMTNAEKGQHGQIIVE